MKLEGIDSIEQILRAFVEETHQRKKEDRELWIYLNDFLSRPYTSTESRGLKEVRDYLRWSIPSNGAIERSCFDEPSANDSPSELSPCSDDNSDNIPF